MLCCRSQLFVALLLFDPPLTDFNVPQYTILYIYCIGFMSAVLQALVHNPLLRVYFLSDVHSHIECKHAASRTSSTINNTTNSTINNYLLSPSPEPNITTNTNTTCVACAIDHLIQSHYLNDSTAYTPNRELYAMWCAVDSLAGYAQQDAHEFYMALLDELHNTLSMKHSKQCDCAVHSIFTGQLRSDVICSKCNECSTVIDPIFDLSIDIPYTEHAPSLYECLQQYTSVEELDDKHKLLCKHCCTYELASKQLSIQHAPRVLTIQIKRFYHTQNMNTGKTITSKIDVYVSFPIHSLQLNSYMHSTMSKSIKSDTSNGTPPHTTKPQTQYLYDLFAVIVHKGSLDNGHYIVYLRRNSDWYRSDDKTITKVDMNEVRSAQAYLLYYVGVT